jgi:hypothetical protein
MQINLYQWDFCIMAQLVTQQEMGIGFVLLGMIPVDIGLMIHGANAI